MLAGAVKVAPSAGLAMLTTGGVFGVLFVMVK